MALRAFQAAQAEGKHAEGVEPGGLREAAGCGDTGEKTFRRHHEGPVPVRVLYKCCTKQNMIVNQKVIIKQKENR